MHGLDIDEDHIRVLRLLQRLTLLSSLQAIVHTLQNVAHRAFAGKVYRRLVLLLPQRGEHVGRRQVGVAPRGLEFRIRLCSQFDDLANVGGTLRMLDLPTRPTTR